MNLIEKLGLEGCRQIVDGAPKEFDFCLITPRGNLIYYREQVGSFPMVCGRNKTDKCVDDYQILYLADLRTAIASHGAPTNEGADNFSHFDHCSDIRNHISPNTVVIER